MLLSGPAAQAKGVYQTGEEFIAEAFAEQSPQNKSLWLTPEIKDVAGAIMNRPVRGLRVRYWHAGGKTAWIMEEIGKELPITIGVVIDQNRVQHIKILAFRESRGGEVRYPAFTSQFKGAKITPDHRLDQGIDGITGATLSVRAVTRVATLALFYHQQATAGAESAREKPPEKAQD